MNRFNSLAAAALLALVACQRPAEQVDLEALLPEGAYAELTYAHPDLSATLVSDDQAGPQVGDQYLVLAGVDDPDRQERFAEYIAGYLNDPERKAREAAERAAYEALSPQEKMANLMERLRANYPDVSYEWVALADGNTSIEYGDNGLVLNGVEGDGPRAEIAHAIYRLQQEIDAVTTQDQ